MGTSLRTSTEDPPENHGQLWTNHIGYIYGRQGREGIMILILVWKEVNDRKIIGEGEGLSSDCLFEMSIDGFAI